MVQPADALLGFGRRWLRGLLKKRSGISRNVHPVRRRLIGQRALHFGFEFDCKRHSSFSIRQFHLGLQYPSEKPSRGGEGKSFFQIPIFSTSSSETSSSLRS